MSEAIDNIWWHDGQLTGIAIDINAKGSCKVRLFANVYPSEQCKVRTPVQLTCKGVDRFASTVDVAELKNNQRAGNISNGYIKGKALWLYLTDGSIEVQAERFSVVEAHASTIANVRGSPK
jgi:hypothetical protein